MERNTRTSVSGTQARTRAPRSRQQRHIAHELQRIAEAILMRHQHCAGRSHHRDRDSGGISANTACSVCSGSASRHSKSRHASSRRPACSSATVRFTLIRASCGAQGDRLIIGLQGRVEPVLHFQHACRDWPTARLLGCQRHHLRGTARSPHRTRPDRHARCPATDVPPASRDVAQTSCSTDCFASCGRHASCRNSAERNSASWHRPASHSRHSRYSARPGCGSATGPCAPAQS